MHIATRSGDWKYYRDRNAGDNYLFDHGNTASEWSGNQAGTNPAKLAELQAEYAEYEASLPGVHWAVGEELAITTYDLDDAETNQSYSMSLTHSPAGESVTWSIIAGQPGWLSINPSTGELTGSPSPADGKHNLITLQIDNGATNSTYRVPLTLVGGHDPDDTDADGLPDAWEMDQFGDLATTAGGSAEDQDLDGSSDRDEYVEGTSAIDSNSYFTTPFAVTGSTFSVSFDGITNRNYVLHTSTNLVDGEWCYGDSIDNLQSNGTTTLEGTICGDPDAFFGRIKVGAE